MRAIAIAGVDASTKSFGYAAPDGRLFTFKARAGAKDPGRRVHELSRQFVDAIRHYPPAPAVVVIEGYGLGTPGRLALVRLGELGGVIRDRLFELEIPYVEIPPSSLKLYATGKGNAKKPAMIAAATELGATPANDDEADAFLLRHLGRAAYGLEETFELGRPHRFEPRSIAGVDWPVLPELVA